MVAEVDSVGPQVQRLAEFSVPSNFRQRSVVFTLVWWLVQATLFRASPQPMYRWRCFLLRRFGAQIGDGVKIRQSARVTYPWKVSIGDNSWIGDRAELYSLVDITIGANTCISQDVYLCTGSHDMNDLTFSYDCDPIVIGDEAWLAAGSFVAPGVVIGDRAVVGARSLVLDSLSAGGVYAGHPARFVRHRCDNERTDNDR